MSMIKKTKGGQGINSLYAHDRVFSWQRSVTTTQADIDQIKSDYQNALASDCPGYGYKDTSTTDANNELTGAACDQAVRFNQQKNAWMNYLCSVCIRPKKALIFWIF